MTSLAALAAAAREATDPRHREHLLSYLWDNRERFRIRNVARLLRSIFEALYPSRPAFGMQDVLDYHDAHSALRDQNAHRRRRYEWPAR